MYDGGMQMASVRGVERQNTISNGSKRENKSCDQEDPGRECPRSLRISPHGDPHAWIADDEE
jgi:hypothetical protein